VDQDIGSGAETTDSAPTSIQLLGAVGQRSRRVRVQCLLDLQISGHKFEVVALIVRNLIKPVILGADWLHERGANVDFELQQLHINSSVGPVVMPLYSILNNILLNNYVKNKNAAFLIEQNTKCKKKIETYLK
jgi:predicted signal transduction protein with EAL and GGDEF domain